MVGRVSVTGKGKNSWIIQDSREPDPRAARCTAESIDNERRDGQWTVRMRRRSECHAQMLRRVPAGPEP
ncbi:hypothetical protein Y032_0449g1652 [Ancylostoma ceylanicum]|uniref:Uncharacterized protein n=1 Tax=Ancylostoma ceylanicum TaxID=53326 RepID=A0A016WY74_9BILA|nr:hypothetical protein Y032_0449g1652 [Ancylostoma ceylanicum]